MKKKIFIAVIVALVVGLGVMGVVSTTYAQEADPQDDVVIEAAGEPVSQPVEMENEFEFAYQYGNQNGEDPIMTQSQTRTRLRELQEDGECTGECDPQQIRLQQNLGAENQPEMRQQRLNDSSGDGISNGPGDGICTGDGVPQRRGGGRN